MSNLEYMNFFIILKFGCLFEKVKSTTFATSIYFVGITKLGRKEVSSFIFLVPSSALVLSAIFLNEKITYNTILGTICIITAIYILNNLNIFKIFVINKN
jgi:drug/metabolite transporter (DMT)-like permease